MNTKEAIQFLKVEIKCLEKEIEICNRNNDIDIQVIEANRNIIIKYNQVIILLQQGEKYKNYKLMWEEFKIYAEARPCSVALHLRCRDYEQKYFPKETNE